jgi:hypothetical protein
MLRVEQTITMHVVDGMSACSSGTPTSSCVLQHASKNVLHLTASWHGLHHASMHACSAIGSKWSMDNLLDVLHMQGQQKDTPTMRMPVKPSRKLALHQVVSVIWAQLQMLALLDQRLGLRRGVVRYCINACSYASLWYLLPEAQLPAKQRELMW